MAFRLYGTRIDWLAETERPRTGEVLVIPANDHLWMLNGPGLELKKAYGKELELEAVRQGPIEPGQVVATDGRALGFRALYHAAVMGQDAAWIEGAGGTAMAAAIDRAIREKAVELVCYPLYRGAHGRKEAPAREMLAGLFGAVREGIPLKQIRVLYLTADEKTMLHEIFLRLLSRPES
jgi:hypothetical protein